VVAPAGYGKTTLLAQWAERDDRCVAWITLDRRDNDPVTLLRHVAAALEEHTPVDPRVHTALAAAKASLWGTIVPRLAGAVAAADRHVLVFDDVHVLSELDSIEILSVLAEHMHESSVVVVSGRVETPAVSRLRLRGRLLELGTDELALTRRETELLVRGAGLDLSDDACARLFDRTEGWAGALQLATLAARQPARGPFQADDERAATFAGDHPYIASYLHAEYLTELSEERLAFLRRTSLLDRMSGPLCDAVLERKHSANELDAIRESNLFLVPLDSHGEWYRYHYLVRDLLHRELVEGESDVVPELGRRASDWFEEHGDLESALDYALATGDNDRAARILVAIALPTSCNGRSETAVGWLARFDDACLLERYPAVAVHGARIYALRGETITAEQINRDIADGAPVLPGNRVNILLYAAWLIKKDYGRKRSRPPKTEAD